MMNLNELELVVDYPPERHPLRDFSVVSEDGGVRVYFRDLESHLIRHIGGADVVVGCVAWLTSLPILRALARKAGVSIVVQKEDWLRPDFGARGDWKTELRAHYGWLPSSLTRFDEGLKGTVLRSMSWGSGAEPIEAVRCVGNYNSEGPPSFPRAHHKFVVFCRLVEGTDSLYRNYVPYEVWTGSFNFTQNAVRSFENAVVLRDPAVVWAYFQEYAQIAALSEVLDWEKEWVEPQWRIGS
jgi:hypothetical protein